MDSIALVFANVCRKTPGRPNRWTVKVSVSPSRRLLAAPGWSRSNSLAKASKARWAVSAFPVMAYPDSPAMVRQGVLQLLWLWLE